MKVFRIGDRVKLTNELLHYSANKHWSGRRGTVIKELGLSYVLVKWDHLDRPIEEPTEYVEHVYE